MSKQILLLDNVHKSIKNKEIVKGITFSINEGEVLGFLGPNGAGKSTTLRMIVGLSSPTSGKILIDGYSITKDYVKAMSKVGCIIEGPDMYNYLSGLENLKMLASMNKNVTNEDITRVIELVGMQNRINEKVSTYSLGMKQRLGLAQALIHKPKLLILDEPTNGLDPSGINEFRHIIKDLAKKENIAVLVSSHLISEVELMCDTVAIIKSGTLLKYDSVSELISDKEVSFVLSDNSKGIKILKDKWNTDSSLINNNIIAKVDVSKIEKINSSFIEEGIAIKFVSINQKTLEDLFLSLTESNSIVS
ncbi:MULTISPECIES: ABC transporter ATP-binding protein [Clostridium]|jgi:ABC-type multidrug transport system, ATPase component|uniref:ABC transporter ATP-binding protein n=1 Tax=Clostridium TaxID=1485 RepID=UPI0013612340|nr:ABC transporter ATP-binding protein [Clostridium beijerinckii]MZK52766.1 ATP-binding cassette domain-containing protein [Clostridium beijerinckii]MZK60867.1 ATP-binding cassette domain-containing protein [Clostridium beijerinckii]MZK71073.1 ATP-binding cassette domain-containing protein [Clostridium beijerinckii]MZK76431.1 ATP-binding cassette domain-containing protein [Clostridium beijerinckii]MZK86134.1 ATP-binding cassette domain-containing protein [Clostridium beijerinckii]